MQLDRLLQHLGFSKNESKVYLAALESGPSSAQNLAKSAGLPRTTTYSVLEYLVERGVVGKTMHQGKTRFLAEPPAKLASIVSDLQKQVERSLPQLEAIYNKSETKPKIYFYEGKGAIRKAFDDTLIDKPKEILMWLTDFNIDLDRYNFDPNYIPARIKLGMHAKRIAGEGSSWQTVNKPNDVRELSETVIVPRKLFWPGVEVMIYDNKVVFINFAENNSVMIESKAIATSMRQAYNLSWIGAKSMEVK